MKIPYAHTECECWTLNSPEKIERKCFLVYFCTKTIAIKWKSFQLSRESFSVQVLRHPLQRNFFTEAFFLCSLIMCTWKFTDIFLQHKTWKPVNKLCGETQRGEEKNFPKLGFHRFSMPSTYPLWIGIGYRKSVMNDQRWRCTADFFPFFWVRHLDECTLYNSWYVPTIPNNFGVWCKTY